MDTIEVMDCGEVSCEYCSKDRCIYMMYNEVKNKVEVESEDKEICE